MKGPPAGALWWDQMAGGCPKRSDPVELPSVAAMSQIWPLSWITCCATRRNGTATGPLRRPTFKSINLREWPGNTSKCSSTPYVDPPCEPPKLRCVKAAEQNRRDTWGGKAATKPVNRSPRIRSANIRRIRVHPGSSASGMNADSADLRGSGRGMCGKSCPKNLFQKAKDFRLSSRE